MNTKDFQLITLQLQGDTFTELYNSAQFEAVGSGRYGNHLVQENEHGIPIVRTTTQYTIPAGYFKSIHQHIIKCINDNVTSEQETIHFNNALIEVYDSRYCKMGYHSDQALDLDPHSYIALFSCYENPNALTELQLRKLKIKDKLSNKEFEIKLSHHSVVLFSVQTNAKFQHKIVLDGRTHNNSTNNSRWLGITFRCSKTFINFHNQVPFFKTGEQLLQANEEQTQEFYKLRRQENNETTFIYPPIHHTLSIADTLMPKN